jgi:hypothetical protein
MDEMASWDEFAGIVGAGDYLVLATADAGGTPWATPVYFRADDRHDLLWVSSAAARHSGNIAARPDVAATIFDSTVPVGGARAAYVAGRAGPLDEEAGVAALGVLNRGLPDGKHLTQDDVRGPGRLRVYRLAVSARWVLVRGGDPRSTSGYDSRLRVAEPVG